MASSRYLWRSPIDQLVLTFRSDNLLCLISCRNSFRGVTREDLGNHKLSRLFGHFSAAVAVARAVDAWFSDVVEFVFSSGKSVLLPDNDVSISLFSLLLSLEPSRGLTFDACMGITCFEDWGFEMADDASVADASVDASCIPTESIRASVFFFVNDLLLRLPVPPRWEICNRTFFSFSFTVRFASFEGDEVFVCNFLLLREVLFDLLAASAGKLLQVVSA